jgi:hypothetical protein
LHEFSNVPIQTPSNSCDYSILLSYLNNITILQIFVYRLYVRCNARWCVSENDGALFQGSTLTLKTHNSSNIERGLSVSLSCCGSWFTMFASANHSVSHDRWWHSIGPRAANLSNHLRKNHFGTPLAYAGSRCHVLAEASFDEAWLATNWIASFEEKFLPVFPVLPPWTARASSG